jgi:hypothetical protein
MRIMGTIAVAVVVIQTNHLWMPGMDAAIHMINVWEAGHLIGDVMHKPFDVFIP